MFTIPLTYHNDINLPIELKISYLINYRKSVHAVVIVKPTLKTSKVVPCMYCPVRFSDKSNMRAHMKIKHYKQYLKFVRYVLNIILTLIKSMVSLTDTSYINNEFINRKRLKYKRPKAPLPIYNIRGYNETEYKPYGILLYSFKINVT